MSKFRALVATIVLTGSLVVSSGAVTPNVDAQAPQGPQKRDGSGWCC
ncbi:hypothetical protein [Nocardioides sp. GXZ039]